VTINVVSARKSSKDKLLDCGAPEDRISTFSGKATQVSCKLIGEHDGLLQCDVGLFADSKASMRVL
jgi:hypothetical protein